jgi:hypothetical protein
MALSKAGADRQEMHEHLRQASMLAGCNSAGANPLAVILSGSEVTRIERRSDSCIDSYSHRLGDASTLFAGAEYPPGIGIFRKF